MRTPILLAAALALGGGCGGALRAKPLTGHTRDGRTFVIVPKAHVNEEACDSL